MVADFFLRGSIAKWKLLLPVCFEQLCLTRIFRSLRRRFILGIAILLDFMLGLQWQSIGSRTLWQLGS